MQVNYRTISSYEYDAISGQYKQVDKQIEDYSSSGDSIKPLYKSKSFDT